MIHVNPFESCSRMPSPSRSPLAVVPRSASGLVQAVPGMILAAREPRATPRRSVHLTSHCPSTAPISSSNRSLTHPAANHYPYSRPWDISAGLLEPGLEVRLRGLQSIRVVGAFAEGFGFLTSDFGVGKSQDLGC